MGMTRRRALAALTAPAAGMPWLGAGPETAAPPAEPDERTDRLVLVYRGRMPDLCVCDQALRRLPDGAWAIFFMTGGDGEPRKDNYIAWCRSQDEGTSWTHPAPVLRLDGKACLLTEVLVHKGRITLLGASHGGRFEQWRTFSMTSDDSGATWSKPAAFEPMPRRAFLRNLYVSTWGEWFLPFQSYDTVEDANASPLDDGSHQRARNGVLISQDEGATWTRSADVGPTAGWAENNVVEAADGRLVMLIRADGTGHLLRSESTDRGGTWSHPAPCGIPNPGSKFRLFRLSTGRIVLIHNPNDAPGVRNPLALWASDDGMVTWPVKRVITAFPGRLQYPDGFLDEAGGYVHFAFDYNRHDLIYVGAHLPA